MTGRVKKAAAGIGALAALGLGAAAIAGAAGSDEQEAVSGDLSGAEAKQARSAALEETGGGTANSVELDGENGATYEVEVTKRDGTTVDVRLDEAFGIVVVEADGDQAGSDD